MLHWKNCLVVVSAILLFNACQKNDTTNDTGGNPVNDTETVSASIRGIVLNENNAPVQGAVVKCGTAMTTTDIFGMFTFNGINISKNNGHVSVTKAGYFNGHRSFITTAGRTHNEQIKLLPKTITGTFTATSGGAVTLGTGGKVTFVANSITDAGGNTYTGTVNVAMTWINPTAADIASVMPGDLRGISSAGNEKVLETYGMLGVELTGSTGQPLKIVSGKTAELSMPIPVALQATAPATIPLWHFDEAKGRWVEEGSATRTGNNYTGNVSHFSFWNCDWGISGVTLCVHAVNGSNQPLNNATIRIRRANNPAVQSYGQTDSLGNVCGLVFANEPLILEVLDRCGNAVYTQNIGPFSANATINVTATIPAVNLITVTGTVVNCSNTAVTSGTVFIYSSGGYYQSVPLTGGAFTTSIVNCSGTTISVSAIATDYSTLQQSIPLTLNSGGVNVNFGVLSACGASPSQFMQVVIDGVPFSWAAPSDSLENFVNSLSPSPGFSRTNAFYARRINTSLVGAANFWISSNDATGNALLDRSSITASSALYSQIVISPGTTVFTEYGPIGTGFIAGTISNAIMDFNGVQRTVNANFRMRRKY